MNKNFLKRLDQQLAEAGQQREVKKEEANVWAEAITRFIAEARPILESYKKELDDRGISVEIQIRDKFLSFKLEHLDRQYQGFELGSTPDGGYTLISIFSDKGQPFHTVACAGAKIEETCSIKALEEKIEREVDHYMLAAPRHGGFRRKS